MRKSTKIGKIIIPYGTSPYPHEIATASLLVLTGHDVIFRVCGRMRTADISYRKIIWELKSPTGSSSRTLENILRCALGQSKNIILDLRRTKIPDSKCLLYLKNHLSSFHGLKRLLVHYSRQPPSRNIAQSQKISSPSLTPNT